MAASAAASASSSAAAANRLPSVRGGFFPSFSSSSGARLLASNFGYPDAAEEAVGKSQSYLEAFVEGEGGEGGRPVVR
jgi:hypothetical protein